MHKHSYKLEIAGAKGYTFRCSRCDRRSTMSKFWFWVGPPLSADEAYNWDMRFHNCWQRRSRETSCA